ncbi:hypothetical protein H5410_047094 [Solanum commersonii]|uniref:Uncharacterized protein n=1 Tax=Solanum commersonii TaxID=4109 RepID=A0A9J5XHB1_SOLCO|nr:hypothetical protein H5410_047094 [Solanum commersonii]KAH0695909.1 hypothetical protein KY289_013391 [Solanum tuberosum]
MDTNNYSILIHHKGRWEASGRYVDYDIEGVIYDANTKYEGLITTIVSQLVVDTTIFHLELKYVVSGPSPPMKIHNDMGYYKETTRQTTKQRS